MGNMTVKIINFSELCELIDLYKRTSIDGDRIDFVVSPTKDDKRLIKLELQNGNSLRELSYLYEDGNDFDNNVYHLLLSFFASGDTLGNWDISQSNKDGLFEGVIETQSGNVIYLETSNKNLFDEVMNKFKMKQGVLTIEDKIWDEIIQYAKNRRLLANISLTEEELEVVYDYITNKGINDDKVKYGNAKNIVVDNENYLIELFGNRDYLTNNGLPESIITKINPTLIKQLAILLGNEKRIKYRLDTEDDIIKAKINFAIFELDSAGYFNLRNRITKEMPTIKCKMGVISKLLSQLNHGKLYTEELNTRYKEFCYEIVGYLYRKGMSNINEDYNSICFEECSTNEKEKDTSELTSNEIEEIIEFVEQSKTGTTNKKDKDLFRVIKQPREEQESYDSLEIEDAYEKSLGYSTELYPSWIKILFEKDNEEEADVIISNKSGSQDLVIYRRPVSIDKLKGEVMDTLRKLFTKNNSIHYNIKYKLDESDNSCLLMVGDKRTTFTIINAPDEFVDYNKKKLEELMG